MSERDEQAGDMEKGRIHFDFVFLAHHPTPIISQPRKGALHLRAFAIAPQFASVLKRGTPPVAPMRTNQLAAAPFQLPPCPVAVVTFVGDHPPQAAFGSPPSRPWY